MPSEVPSALMGKAFVYSTRGCPQLLTHSTSVAGNCLRQLACALAAHAFVTGCPGRRTVLSAEAAHWNPFTHFRYCGFATVLFCATFGGMPFARPFRSVPNAPIAPVLEPAPFPIAASTCRYMFTHWYAFRLSLPIPTI